MRVTDVNSAALDELTTEICLTSKKPELHASFCGPSSGTNSHRIMIMAGPRASFPHQEHTSAHPDMAAVECVSFTQILSKYRCSQHLRCIPLARTQCLTHFSGRRPPVFAFLQGTQDPLHLHGRGAHARHVRDIFISPVMRLLLLIDSIHLISHLCAPIIT